MADNAFSDRDQAELLTRSITSSDEEYEALLHALTLRARAFIRHKHFRALHRHLTDALLRDDTLRQFPDVENVESIAAGVAADPNAPAGEWYVRMGSVWRSTHPVVQAHPEWFVPLGDGQTSPA